MMTMTDKRFADESVVEWAWRNDRSDVRAWRNGHPIYQRSNWAEVLTDEVGERATEFIYAENHGDVRWPPALSSWETADLLRRSSDVVWPEQFDEPEVRS